MKPIITAADIREHIPEHLRGIVHINTRRPLPGQAEDDATLITLEVRFATHAPIFDETTTRIPRDVVLPATAESMIRKLDEVIREWPGVTTEVVEIAPNVDDAVHALRRISGEVEHWATRLAHPDDAPDEADPTPPHGTPRPGGYKWNDPPDEPHMICPECGGSGTYQRAAEGIAPRPCERCGTTGWITTTDHRGRTGAYCQSTRGNCVCKHVAGHTAGHECGCGEVWRSIKDAPQA